MPTVTHFFKTYFPDTQGGLEEAIRQIGKYSISKGYNVNVVSISSKQKIQYLDGIRCITFKKNFGISTMPISFTLWRKFKNIVQDSDIIQLHFPYPYVELLTLFYCIKKPIVVTFHAEIVGRNFLMNCYRPFAERLFEKVNVIVPTSQNLADTTVLLKKYSSKISPINLWLDKERFSKLCEPSEEFKTEVSNFNDYALFVGVLRPYKGLDVLLDAAKSVVKNVVIVGKGPEISHLKERIFRENINNVFLLGYQSDDNVAYLLKKSTFLVLPSCNRGECFGQVLLEASYYHKAMISTELGTGTSFVNLDAETGFVVPPNNSQLLSQKMNLLFSDMELCLRMGENAYKRYNDYFTESIQGEKYVRLYEKLLSNDYCNR